VIPPEASTAEGLSNDSWRSGFRVAFKRTKLAESVSWPIGSERVQGTILCMLRTAKAIKFVPSEWEAAVCGVDTLHIRYAPGELVCSHGSYVAGLHLILSGVVSQASPRPSGSPCRPDLLGVGDLIGIEVLADARNEIARSACLAITEVELLFFERRAFNEQVLCNPALGHRLLKYLASRHMDPQGGVRHTGSDQDALGELLLRLGALCGDSDPSGLVRLPEAINPRTLQELSGLAGRRFRDAWGAIDTLGSEGSQVVFCGESLLKPVQESFDEPSPS